MLYLPNVLLGPKYVPLVPAILTNFMARNGPFCGHERDIKISVKPSGLEGGQGGDSACKEDRLHGQLDRAPGHRQVHRLSHQRGTMMMKDINDDDYALRSSLR